MRKESTRRIRRLVKVGGAALRARRDLEALVGFLRARRGEGESLLVVHGGGPEISDLHDRFGVPFEKRDGMRVTSEAGMPLTTMVLCGLVNKRLVACMVSAGLPGVGLCGVDASLLRAEFLDRQRFGRVGSSPVVDTTLLEVLLDAGQIPVIAPVSLGADGEPINVNADDAAHALAAALGVDCLDFVSDVPGLLDAESQVISSITCENRAALMEDKVVTGGMIPKLNGAFHALEHGVGRVRIGDLCAMSSDSATEIRV